MSAKASPDFVFTSESVTEGHPDKVCDLIADSILDAHLALDRDARVACEVLCKDGQVILAGEITANAEVDVREVTRNAIREIGYVEDSEPFSADWVTIQAILSKQAPEIAARTGSAATSETEQGAGDQGLMFGYATDETPELMPLPILLAHRLSKTLADDRHQGRVAWLRPDAKTQVSVLYRDGRPVSVTDILVSTQHRKEVSQGTIREYVADDLVPRVLGDWNAGDIRILVNPSGSFVLGGPSADAGVTGRKIIVDTYGGFARHGGGAFSGKDPSKVDRSGAYFCRYLARKIVTEGLARRAEIQVSYAIGQAKPVSVMVETFGTGDPGAASEFVRGWDFRPAEIIRELDLLKPIYRQTTNYGHFGRPGLPWER